MQAVLYRPSAPTRLISDAMIVLPPAPPQTSIKMVSKKNARQRMIPRFRLHGAPHLNDIGENDPKDSKSRLLGVLGFVILVYMSVLTPQNQSLFSGGGLSRHDSDAVPAAICYRPASSKAFSRFSAPVPGGFINDEKINAVMTGFPQHPGYREFILTLPDENSE